MKQLTLVWGLIGLLSVAGKAFEERPLDGYVGGNAKRQMAVRGQPGLTGQVTVLTIFRGAHG